MFLSNVYVPAFGLTAYGFIGISCFTDNATLFYVYIAMDLVAYNILSNSLIIHEQIDQSNTSILSRACVWKPW
jgi:hypothetical protein